MKILVIAGLNLIALTTFAGPRPVPVTGVDANLVNLEIVSAGAKKVANGGYEARELFCYDALDLTPAHCDFVTGKNDDDAKIEGVGVKDIQRILRQVFAKAGGIDRANTQVNVNCLEGKRPTDSDFTCTFSFVLRRAGD
jgi:hypothetical protein